MRFKQFVPVHITIKFQNKNSYLVLYILKSYTMVIKIACEQFVFLYCGVNVCVSLKIRMLQT